MSKFFDCLTEELQDFITAQHLFFVGSAPLSATGHVNLSPKGLDCFRIFSPNRVGYVDLTGSGNETSAHLQENGRITFMFCACELPRRKTDGASQFIGNSQQELCSSSWSDIPSKGRSPGSQDPNLSLATCTY
jgi:Pyridoxamine 5'-phosphate oxidase